MEELLDKAVDPSQYDKPAANWAIDGAGLSSPTRAHFWSYLQRYAPDWEGKDILDIGAGSGWLMDLALDSGARSVLGIDPSKNNVDFAREHYPRVSMVQTRLEDFIDSRRFDLAIALLSFVHIRDLRQGFTKIAGLLREPGELLVVVPDFVNFRRPKPGRRMTFEEINEQEYVGEIERPQGTLTDIVRSNERYHHAAQIAGMRLVEEVPITASEVLIRAQPKYQQDKDRVLSRLFRYQH
jgi:2-polyprenyl-3-methyl-5-hydroxy-6-metoxy-1,4-benzoquinol methylase